MATLKGDGASFFQILIGAVIAISFLIVIANATVAQTTTFERVNVTADVPSAENGTTDLLGRALISADTPITNVSTFETPENVSLITGTGANGLQSVQLLLNGTSAGTPQVNVSYSYQPDGYLPLGSTRSIALLILVFGSLGILIFVLVVLIQRGALGRLIGRT